MVDVTGYVGTRPRHCAVQDQGRCRSEFVAQSGMRARGSGAKRMRPFEFRLDKGVTVEAR